MNKNLWNLLLTCLLAAPALSPAAWAADPAAAPAYTPAPTITDRSSFLRAVDLLIGEADARIRSIDAGGAGAVEQPNYASAKASCLKTMTPESITREVAKTASLPGADITQTDPVISDIESYHLCRALAGKDPRYCEALKSLSPRQSDFCLEHYWEESMITALVTRSKDAARVCAQATSREKIKIAADIPQFCAALADSTQDAAQSCRKLGPLMEPGERGKCPERIKSVYGMDDCDKPTDDPLGPFWCEQNRAVKKASAAKNAGLCGAKPFCRVLLGGGSSFCRPFADKIKARYCDVRVKPLDSASLARQAAEQAAHARAEYQAKEKGVRDSLKLAQSRLVMLDAAAVDPDAAFARDIDSRLERIARLEESLRLMGSKLPPVNGSPNHAK